MRRLSEVAGLKVLSKASAEKIGKLDRILVDVPPRRVVAVQVGRDEVVDWEALSGIGHDAVVVDDEQRVRAAADAWEERALSGDFDWKGKIVLSDRGNQMGTVVDVEIDEQSGELLALDTSEGPVDANRLRALGSYCVVVRYQADAALPG
ncbi:MAG TPA: PRC-barrel domain-containing protein [Acidimicrobiales bacterium]|jgi:uncharacterized protein YrrD|nr:PRC-barrel domain-containing protein [Acidimicrobiales bacterium]